MKEFVQAFWQILNSGFLAESVARVRVEYDDNRVNIRAATFAGDRLRRLKLKKERVRNVYYYEQSSESVRKDKFDSDGLLERSDQHRGGERRGAQVKRTKHAWRVRDGEDRDNEHFVETRDELASFDVIVGPPLGQTDDTTSLLAQFGRDLASLYPKLVKRERCAEFRYDAELQTLRVEIDRKHSETFKVEEL